MMRTPCLRLRAVAAIALAALLTISSGCGSDDDGGTGHGDQPASTLLDLSGMAWVGGDQFVAVHDAKNPGELDRARVSVLTLASGPEGTLFRDVDLDWPDVLGPSSDLESATSIPGRDQLLFAESGDDGNPDYRRIFLAEWDGARLTITDFTFWPVDIFNVEAIAIARLQDEYFFTYAERAEGEPATEIRWASFDPDTLQFGAFRGVQLDNPDPAGANRPLVGMDVDSDGNVYIVSAFDPDVDGGPFRSSVFLVGQFDRTDDAAELLLDPEPTLLARVDGFKTESVVVREIGGQRQLLIGTDDEDLGNVLRPLP